jgi:uncharacterized protein YggU (UPF0235/DUF167 family)
MQNGRLRVKIAAAPENGRANKALCEYLAGILGCAKSEISIIKGEKSRLKTLELPERVKEKVEEMCSGGMINAK